MGNLMDKAMACPGKKSKTPVGPDVTELAVAWAEGKLTTRQVNYAFDTKHHSSSLGKMMYALRDGVRSGSIKISNGQE